jgi:hypothetical protein
VLLEASQDWSMPASQVEIPRRLEQAMRYGLVPREPRARSIYMDVPLDMDVSLQVSAIKQSYGRLTEPSSFSLQPGLWAISHT